jgi:4-hydroxy-4-methyl-2-oxoglutarate aldolase
VKETPGELDVPVVVGGAVINPGDIVVMDGDGVAVVPVERADEVLAGAQAREEKEIAKRAKLETGLKSYEIDGLRAVVEGAA